MLDIRYPFDRMVGILGYGRLVWGDCAVIHVVDVSSSPSPSECRDLFLIGSHFCSRVGGKAVRLASCQTYSWSLEGDVSSVVRWYISGSVIDSR